MALKQGLEQVRALRYKLRMMGIPVEDPCWVFGDNMSVVNNVSRPESTLKKKSHEICYHYARESVVMGESAMTHVRSELNPSDICTKVVPGGNTTYTRSQPKIHVGGYWIEGTDSKCMLKDRP